MIECTDPCGSIIGTCDWAIATRRALRQIRREWVWSVGSAPNQARGIMPGVVQDVIANGVESPGSQPGTVDFTKDGVTVVWSTTNNQAVTVIPNPKQ